MKPDFPRDLQRQVEQALVEGEYPIGQTVTLADFAYRFRAPVDQIRQVVQAAYRKGLLDHSAGQSDTFQVLGLARTTFSSVFTHTAESGLKPRSEVRAVEVVAASQEVAEHLAVALGSPVYRYVRTRYVEEQALANQVNYMPFEICPGLEEDDVTRASFQKLLEGKYRTITAEMKEQFRLAPADQEDRQILGLCEGSLVLWVERTAISATGWPVIWANIHIRPDRYQYVAALWPEAATLLR